MATSPGRPGRYFKSQVSLVAKVSSQVHLIAWQDLLRIARVYPEIRERVMEQMELAYDLDSRKMVSKRKEMLCLDNNRDLK